MDLCFLFTFLIKSFKLSQNLSSSLLINLFVIFKLVNLDSEICWTYVAFSLFFYPLSVIRCRDLFFLIDFLFRGWKLLNHQLFLFLGQPILFLEFLNFFNEIWEAHFVGSLLFNPSLVILSQHLSAGFLISFAYEYWDQRISFLLVHLLIFN